MSNKQTTYEFISENINEVTRLLGIKEVSEIEGDGENDDLVYINDDVEEVTWHFALNEESMDDPDFYPQPLVVNGTTIFYSECGA